MYTDTESAERILQEAKIELQKSILIIPASPGGLTSTKKYLLANGWTVTSHHGFKEALEHLIENKPDAVLVCMDHTNKNVSALPELILERVRTCVIATTQKATVENHRLLQNAKCPFKLFPPSAGSAVMRVFSKYENQLNQPVDIRGSYELKRSGISPKSFRVHGKGERTSDVIDYANLNYKFKQPAPVASYVRVPENQLLILGTERLISEIIETENANKLPVQKIERTSQMTCMLIECEKFQGYLVAVLGADCYLDEKFNGIVRKHLIQFLKDQNQTVSAVESFNINIKPVAFLDWANEYADFLRQSIHKENEIAFAFFPLEGVRGSYQPANLDGMLSVPIEDFNSEGPLGFDLYIFFPANKRYVLYTPMGAIFQAHQKERLVDRGIENLYIRQNALPELNRYRAQKYFNTIVEEYNSHVDMLV